MGYDANGKWAEPDGKKDPMDLSTEYPSAPEIPVDTSLDDSGAEDAAAAKKQAEIDALDEQRQKELEQEEERRRTKFHGPDTPETKTSLQQWRAGEISAEDLYLQTGLRKLRVSDKDNDRDKELYGPGIHVTAPGLDRWHSMNPDSTPAAPSRLGFDSQLSSGPAMQVKPPWANVKRDISKIQTPVHPPQTPMLETSSKKQGSVNERKFQVKEGTVSSTVPVKRKPQDA